MSSYQVCNKVQKPHSNLCHKGRISNAPQPGYPSRSQSSHPLMSLDVRVRCQNSGSMVNRSLSRDSPSIQTFAVSAGGLCAVVSRRVPASLSISLMRLSKKPKTTDAPEYKALVCIICIVQCCPKCQAHCRKGNGIQEVVVEESSELEWPEYVGRSASKQRELEAQRLEERGRSASFYNIFHPTLPLPLPLLRLFFPGDGYLG